MHTLPLAMSDEEIKSWFERYRTELSREIVISELTGKGLSASFAERAADGHWNPKRAVQHRVRNALIEIRNRHAS